MVEAVEAVEAAAAEVVLVDGGRYMYFKRDKNWTRLIPYWRETSDELATVSWEQERDFEFEDCTIEFDDFALDINSKIALYSYR